MTLLLDTQVAIWWLVGSRRLGSPARKLLAGSACVFSAASVWEVAIKHRLGKLSVAPALFRDRMIAAGAELLMVSDTHAIETAALPLHHDDPFDRMLVAQSMAEGLTIVTRDPWLEPYGVPVLAA